MEGRTADEQLYTTADVKRAIGPAPCAPSEVIMMLDDRWSVIKHSEGTES